MVLLIYSERCKYCNELIMYIRSQPVFLTLIRFHNINTHGVPNGLTRVPTLITDDGVSVIGGDIKNYLDSLLPTTIESASLGGEIATTHLDGTVDFNNFFTNDSFGVSLAPPMTPELEEKIKRNVQDAYQTVKK